MPRLLSGSTLRKGGSGEFIDLRSAMPQLPPTPTTATGFTLITNQLLQTSYVSSLGYIEFNSSTMYSSLSEGSIKIVATGTTFLSTSTSTGNLIVEGGIGVGGNMFIEEDIVVNGLTIGKGFEGINNIVIKGEAQDVSNNFNIGQQTIIIGYDSLNEIATSNKTIAIGRYTLNSGTELTDTIAIGDSTLRNIGSIDKILIGTISNVTLNNSVLITNISNSNPIQITAPTHNLTSGDQIYVSGVNGLELSGINLVNEQVLYASVIDSNNFTLFYDKLLTIGVNGVGSSSYSSGGTVLAPIVITLSTGELSTGSYIKIENVSGTIELNDKNYFVTKLSSNTYGLYLDSITEQPENGTNFSSYVSGGTIYRKYLRTGNIGYGNSSGEKLIDGRENVFIGHQAGFNITTGSYNIIIGHNKLPYLTSGSGIISIGGDNIVNGLNDQVNIGSVFYYDGQGYAYIAADTNIGLGTNSIGTNSGALVVVGGQGISNDLWVGGTIYGNLEGNLIGNIQGNSQSVSTVNTTNNSTHYFTFVDSNNSTSTAEIIYTSDKISINPNTGDVILSSYTESTSTTTGALVINGGVGIGGDVWIDKRLNSESVRIADSVFDSTTISLSNNATAIIDVYSLLEFRSAKYFVQITEGSGSTAQFQAQELTVLANNTGTAFISEYGLVTSNGPTGLGSFDAIVDGNDVKLRFTPDFSTVKTVKVLRIAMEI